MKKIYTVICSLCLLLSFGGCDDFLEEKSEDSFTNNTLFETPEGLDKMVIALYTYERDIVKRGDNSNGFLAAHLWGERTTDLSVFTTGDDADLSRYSSPSSNKIQVLLYNPFWNTRYYEIGRANEVIAYGTPMGEAAASTVAEASFWRAYCYYGLWSRFSTCFLSTEPVNKENFDKLDYTPADSTDVFRLMYADIDRAIQGLPLTRTDADKGRVTRATARHMKCLIAAWSRDWQAVANQFQAIEKEHSHALSSSLTSIFSKSDLCLDSETLFALRFANKRGGGPGHRLGSQHVNQMADAGGYTSAMIGGTLVQYNLDNLGKQWGISLPNSYLMSLYPEGDKRLDAYYKRHYTYQNPAKLPTIPVSKIITDAGQTTNSTTNAGNAPVKKQIGDIIYGRDLANAGTGFTKLSFRQYAPSSLKMVDLWSKTLGLDASESYKDIMIYRLSETYLLGAEAYMHLNKQDSARYCYNKSWERANGTAETRAITFDMLRDEQARELAFEGRRYDFLKRNGIWYKQMQSYSGDFTNKPSSKSPYDAATYGVSDGRDKNFKPKLDYYYNFNGADNDHLVRFNVKPAHVRWPIPQAQLDAMGPGFPQNEGYPKQ